MSSQYRFEIRDKVREYLYGLGRIEDARSIGKSTSMEKLREKTSFSSIEEMYDYFSHVPFVRNPNGGPDNDPTPCYLLFGETSVKVTRFPSERALIEHIGLDYDSSKQSINNTLRVGGARLHIGKYVFAITRTYTTSIESILLSRNNNLNIRIAAKIEGVPNSKISMYDIAKHIGVKTGKWVTKRLCKNLGIEYQKTNGVGNPDSISRHTALTNLDTREVYEFRCIRDAARYLKVYGRTLIWCHGKRETIPLYGVQYSIDIEYS